MGCSGGSRDGAKIDFIAKHNRSEQVPNEYNLRHLGRHVKLTRIKRQFSAKTSTFFEGKGSRSY